MFAPPQTQAGELDVLAETDEITALRLTGEFDLRNAPQVVDNGERLLADDKQLILDLSEATFIDVAVIHALSRLEAEARKNGRVVVLQLGTAPIVERLIEISQIDRVLSRVSTRPEALKKIRRLQGEA